MKFFVTATGTDVGKTFVTCGLLRAWRAEGFAATAVKPVVSGYDPARAAASDPGLLLAAMGEAVTEATLDRVSPFRFAAPLSPDIAAAREGRAIDLAAVLALCRSSGACLVEGVGGVMAPLTDRQTVLDWIAALDWPVLLVAGSYVGTISHTLTALSTLQRSGVTVARIVVSETPGGPEMTETLAGLRRFAAGVTVVPVPFSTAHM